MAMQVGQGELHARFLAMLPGLRSVWRRYTAGHRGREARDDFEGECTALAWARFLSLVAAGRRPEGFPWRLATRIAGHVRRGRRLGSNARAREPLDPVCDHRTAQHPARSPVGALQVADHRADPADVAAARIDVGEWIDGLTDRQREQARILAAGWNNTEAGAMLGVTGRRVAHVRQELRQLWNEWQGVEV